MFLDLNSPVKHNVRERGRTGGWLQDEEFTLLAFPWQPLSHGAVKVAANTLDVRLRVAACQPLLCRLQLCNDLCSWFWHAARWCLQHLGSDPIYTAPPITPMQSFEHSLTTFVNSSAPVVDKYAVLSLLLIPALMTGMLVCFRRAFQGWHCC
jgi:hypothetical protein